MRWNWKKFEALTNLEIYEIIQLRERVFVVEQNCPYQDVDGLDPKAWHLSGRDEKGQLQAYLRVFAAGDYKFKEHSIGRVVTSPEARGTGVGREMMKEGIRFVREELKASAIRISAQGYLEKFYTELGFKRVSDSYLEDNIPHYEMLLVF